MVKNLTLAILTIAILSAPAAHSQGVDIDNVVIVLDASGSMNDTMRDAQGRQVRKIDAAKAALYEVLNQVPETTHIGLFVFSSTKGAGLWFYELGPKDDAKLKQDRLSPNRQLRQARPLSARVESHGIGQPLRHRWRACLPGSRNPAGKPAPGSAGASNHQDGQ